LRFVHNQYRSPACTKALDQPLVKQQEHVALKPEINWYPEIGEYEIKEVVDAQV
jgi:hypothetical protein